MEKTNEIDEYLKGAREFAESALRASSSAVVIQDGFKATEFALYAYAAKMGWSIPQDHWQTKNVAYRLGKSFGKCLTKCCTFIHNLIA